MARKVESVVISIPRLIKRRVTDLNGNYCCLGQLAIQSGIAVDEPARQGRYMDVYDDLELVYGRKFVDAAWKLNDRDDLKWTEKKSAIRNLFHKNGIAVAYEGHRDRLQAI